MRIHPTTLEQARKLAARASKNHNPSRAQFRNLVLEFIERLQDRIERKFPDPFKPMN